VKKILAAAVALVIVLAIIALLFLRDESAQTPVAASGQEQADEAAAADQDALTAEADSSADAVDEALTASGEAVETTVEELAGQAGSALDELEAATGIAGDTSAGLTETQDEPLRPSFDVVRVEPSGDAVMAGRAAPGARVSVLSSDGVIAQTQADGNGEWVIVLDEPMAPGSHEIWLQAEGADGVVTESREAVVMTIPGGDGSVLAQEGGGAESDEVSSGGSVLAVTVPREDSTGAVAVLQAPAGGVGIAGGGALTLESLSYDEQGAVTLSGKAEPGTEVRPYVDGELAGSALADADGNWNMTLNRTLDAGRHDLRVDQVDGGGAVVARLETPIQQAAFTMPNSAEPLVVIQPGNNLWLIARHIYGRGMLYTQIFEANRDQIGDPDLIYPGQIFVLPEAVQTGG